MTSSLANHRCTLSDVFSTIFLFLTFLNIHIYFIILKTYNQQFTFTTKKSLHIIFKSASERILVKILPSWVCLFFWNTVYNGINYHAQICCNNFNVTWFFPVNTPFVTLTSKPFLVCQITTTVCLLTAMSQLDIINHVHRWSSPITLLLLNMFDILHLHPAL